MKTKKVSIILLLAILGVSQLVATSDRVFSHSEVFLRPIKETTGGMFSWVRKGVLYRVFTSEKECWGAIYREANGHLLIVSQEASSVGEMISSEVDEKKLPAFLHNDLPAVFLALLEGRAWVVNQWYLDSMKELQSEPDLGYFDPQMISASLPILEKYVSPSMADIIGNSWSRAFYVARRDGGIERWDVSGKMAPFTVAVLTRTKVESAGTVLPLPTVGG
jgi:hypothetical protein